jgi:head-tail adaptor
MENRINFGELDTLVLLRSCVITYGAQGAKKYNFQDYAEVYAKVDRNVAEAVTNTNIEEGQEIALTIYKVQDLTTRWRVVVEERSYEISGIDPVSRISPLCHLTLHAVD